MHSSRGFTRAYDNCAVTAEFKKQKCTYYRCTGYRGKCDLPYFREEIMAERLGQVLQADPQGSVVRFYSNLQDCGDCRVSTPSVSSSKPARPNVGSVFRQERADNAWYTHEFAKQCQPRGVAHTSAIRVGCRDARAVRRAKRKLFRARSPVLGSYKRPRILPSHSLPKSPRFQIGSHGPF
jgi:hypothetical protein